MSAEKQHAAGAPFLKHETAGLYEPNGPVFLGKTVERVSRDSRALAAGICQWQEWREAAHQIKAYAIGHLDRLLVEFERNITARGVTVLWAEDAEQANQFVLDLAKEHGVTRLVKAKSMLTEELGLNHHLEAAGIRVRETDLGEFIVQMAGQRPVHLVGPSLHLSAGEVGRLFEEKLGEAFTAEHAVLTDAARRHLRQEYLDAEMGISGVNFGIAETGTLCIVENEGNGGLSTAAPPVHVALMGIEKLIPRIADLPVFLNLLARSCSAQRLTTYTHLVNGPAPGRKLYLIILDNGRTRILSDPAARKALYCMRCGACMNACPVYRRVGGWAYGWVYPGPIGAILTPHLVGFEQAGELPFASSLCGACAEVCPAKIDIPHQLVHLRHRAVNEPSPANSLVDRITWKAWAWAMTSPWRYRMAMTAVRWGVRCARFLPWHPGKLGAWTRGRELPEVPRRSSFRTWWRRHGSELSERGKRP